MYNFTNNATSSRECFGFWGFGSECVVGGSYASVPAQSLQYRMRAIDRGVEDNATMANEELEESYTPEEERFAERKGS